MKFESISIGENLELTLYNIQDVVDLAKEINDPEIYNNTLTIPYPYKLEDGHEFISKVKELELESGKYQNFAIRFHKKVIGGTGLLYNYGYDSDVSEIGYWISKNYRNRGIMSKAIRALIFYAFDNAGLIKLEAQVFPANIASAKVLTNNHFQFIERKKDGMLKDGKFLDTLFFTLKKEDAKY